MKLFFIGIAGAGMASLARYALAAGHVVSGSDPYASAEARAYWTDCGCTVFSKHAASNIDGADLVIYSSAIPESNVELKAARDLGIAVSRGEALARFANGHGGAIAVCGTHGKGTTAGAISHILQTAGIKTSDILGAVPRGRRSSSQYVENATYLVCEVDESDRTHLFHRPKILLLNNVEVDHLNTYSDLDDIVDTFADHIRACDQTHVFVHYAGVGAPKLYERLRGCEHVSWIASEDHAEPEIAWRYRILSVSEEARHTIELWSDACHIVLECGLSGFANAQDLISAAVVALSQGVPTLAVREAVRTYAGLCDRCEVTTREGASLVTDYASHPTCIRNDIAWNRRQCERIIAVYHPYRYSLMAYHWPELAETLSAADIVLLAPFDGAGETPIPGLSSGNLANMIHARRAACEAHAFDTFEAVEAYAKQILRRGDRLIIFGGGPLFAMGHRILDAFKAGGSSD